MVGRWNPAFLVVVLLAALALATIPSGAAQGTPSRVFRINPPTGLDDPTFRDNALSLDDPAFEGALMDVMLPPFQSEPLAWGNERFVMQDSPVPPDGVAPRRDDPRFLEQMAYFYLNHAMVRLEALGYTDLFDGPVPVFAHNPSATTWRMPPSPSPWPDAYATGAGLFFFYRSPSPQGDGGTGSAAEDADVVVHELGHLVHFAAAPQVGYDPEWYGRYAEGTADLFSQMLNDDLTNGVGDACHSEWMHTYYPSSFPTFDAQGFACSRALDHVFTWPEDRFDEPHRDGMFWSGPMWTVRDAIGTNATLRLLMEALPLLPEELTSFEDMAHAVLLADAGLYDGAHEGLIRAAFEAKGIQPQPLADLLGVRPAPAPRVADPATAPSTSTPPPVPRESPGAWAALPALALVAVAALRRRRQA